MQCFKMLLRLFKNVTGRCSVSSLLVQAIHKHLLKLKVLAVFEALAGESVRLSNHSSDII